MKDLRKMNKSLLIIVSLLCIFGLVMIFSSSSASTILRYGYSSSHFFVRQLIVVIAAYFLGFFILLIPTKYYKLFVNMFVILIFSLLLGVLLYGKIKNNAQSWFELGPINIQPSEFAKTAIILFMAYYYNSINKKSNNLSLYLIPLAVAFGMFILIVLQPDLGSAAIFLAISVFCFFKIPYVQKHKKNFFKIGFLAIIIVAGFIALNANKFLTEERKERLFEFANPCERYQDDSGYQVCNGFIAIASGGLFGVGLGQSTQKYLYLPESHTDFIFPIICEECGALVGIIIVLIYGVILYKILKISKEASNLRNKIISYGTFWYLALHIIINLMGILALIPLTGVPLPFLSYGGSFTLNAIIMIFLTERVSIENKQNKLNKALASI